jgi:hypothetical protein
VVDSSVTGNVAPTAVVDSSVVTGHVAPTAVVDASVTGNVAPTAVVECSRKRLLDTGSTETFGKLCRRILTFLASEPSLLVVGGPTGCGKLTAAQHCVAHAGYGLVEIVNESAAPTRIISEIKRSGSMLVATGDSKSSVIVVSGADGLENGISELLNCSRRCKKHVIIIANSLVPFSTAMKNEVFRCNWQNPWSSDALMATLNAVPGADLLTVQEKGVMMRNSNDLRQLKTAAEMLVGVKRLGCIDSSVMHALCDSPVHLWYNTLDIVKGKPMSTELHNLDWIGGSYLGGMTSIALDEAAQFASNLTVADMLQRRDDGNYVSDSFSALVLQSSMPLVVHNTGVSIQRMRLDLPRPNKRARYSYALENSDGQS